jgi:hypothetical protein
MTHSGHLERKPAAVFRECHLFVSACWRRNLHVPAGRPAKSPDAIFHRLGLTNALLKFYVVFHIYLLARRQRNFKVFLFCTVQEPLVGQGLIIGASQSHSVTRHSVGHLWTGDQPDAETSIWQHNTYTRLPRPHALAAKTTKPQITWFMNVNYLGHKDIA